MNRVLNYDLAFIEDDYFRKHLSRYIQFILDLDLNIIGILLYGSVATGRARNDEEHLSDIDLIIVCENLSGDRMNRKQDIFNLTKPVRSGIQDMWLTPEELEMYVDSKFYLILDAFDEGKILYDPKEFLTRLKNKLFKELEEKGVIKTDLYWQWPVKKFGDKIEY